MNIIEKMKTDLFAILAELKQNRQNMNAELIKTQTIKLELLYELLKEEIDEDYWTQIEKELNYE